MTTTLTIRAATQADAVVIREIAIATGLFDEESWPEVSVMMSESIDAVESDHTWIVAESADGHNVLGAGYYAPEPFAHRMWNLYFLGVMPGSQGSGVGRSLVTHVEDVLRARGERVLIIETSGVHSFEPTRTFYRQNGYDEEARIREFYGPGDDKVVFWKALQPGTAGTGSSA